MVLFPSGPGRIAKAGLALLFCCLPIASSARAQTSGSQEYKFELFAQFGGAFYTSVIRNFDVMTVPPTPLREENTFATTGRFLTGVRWGLTDHDKIEASFAYSPGRTNSLLTGPPPFVGPTAPDVLVFYANVFSFNYVRTFESTGRVQPFLNAGAGFVIFHGGLETETKPAGNFGIGMDFRLTDRWAFRLEQRTVISGAPRGIGPNRDGRLFHFVPSAGFVFRF